MLEHVHMHGAHGFPRCFLLFFVRADRVIEGVAIVFFHGESPEKLGKTRKL